MEPKMDGQKEKLHKQIENLIEINTALYTDLEQKMFGEFLVAKYQKLNYEELKKFIEVNSHVVGMLQASDQNSKCELKAVRSQLQQLNANFNNGLDDIGSISEVTLEKITSLESKLKQKDQIPEEAQKNLLALKKDIQGKDQIIQTLQQDVQSLRTLETDIKEKDRIILMLEQDIQSINALENHAIEDMRIENSNLHQELKYLRKYEKAFEIKIQEKDRIIEELKKNFQSIHASDRDEIHDLKIKSSQLLEELEDLKKQNQIASKTTKHLEQEIDSFKAVEIDIQQKDQIIQILQKQIHASDSHAIKEVKMKNCQLLKELEDLNKLYHKALKTNKTLTDEHDRFLVGTFQKIDDDRIKLQEELFYLSDVKEENNYSKTVIANLRSEIEELKTQLQLRDKEIAKTKALTEKREQQAAKLGSSNPFYDEVKEYTGKSCDNFWAKEMSSKIRLMEKEMLDKDEIIDRLVTMSRTMRPAP